MTQPHCYLGLMSGTSADAIDAVLVDFAESKPKLIATHSLKLDNSLTTEIHALTLPSENEIDRLGDLDVRLGKLFAQAALELIARSGQPQESLIAIGSHGQTIRHRPPPQNPNPFSLQIGDPNLIAQLTGITTVADFRRRDMAAGGQGAPLVPAFHHHMFHDPTMNRAVLNLGGIANITWLPKVGKTLGFDTGPANVLMDVWIKTHLNQSYDKNGAWAATGQFNQELLDELLKHPYFALPAPKSTGREQFNSDWLNSNLIGKTIAPEDVQATLLSLTAETVTQAIKGLGHCNEVIVCGGGAYNPRLMQALEHSTKLPVKSSLEFGIAPEWIEAMAFAWLAKQTIEHRTGNLPDVTGARQAVILGGIYLG